MGYGLGGSNVSKVFTVRDTLNLVFLVPTQNGTDPNDPIREWRNERLLLLLLCCTTTTMNSDQTDAIAARDEIVVAYLRQRGLTMQAEQVESLLLQRTPQTTACLTENTRDLDDDESRRIVQQEQQKHQQTTTTWTHEGYERERSIPELTQLQHGTSCDLSQPSLVSLETSIQLTGQEIIELTMASFHNSNNSQDSTDSQFPSMKRRATAPATGSDDSTSRLSSTAPPPPPTTTTVTPPPAATVGGSHSPSPSHHQQTTGSSSLSASNGSRRRHPHHQNHKRRSLPANLYSKETQRVKKLQEEFFKAKHSHGKHNHTQTPPFNPANAQAAKLSAKADACFQQTTQPPLPPSSSISSARGVDTDAIPSCATTSDMTCATATLRRQELLSTPSSDLERMKMPPVQQGSVPEYRLDDSMPLAAAVTCVLEQDDQDFDVRELETWVQDYPSTMNNQQEQQIPTNAAADDDAAAAAAAASSPFPPQDPKQLKTSQYDSSVEPTARVTSVVHADKQEKFHDEEEMDMDQSIWLDEKLQTHGGGPALGKEESLQTLLSSPPPTLHHSSGWQTSMGMSLLLEHSTLARVDEALEERDVQDTNDDDDDEIVAQQQQQQTPTHASGNASARAERRLSMSFSSLLNSWSLKVPGAFAIRGTNFLRSSSVMDQDSFIIGEGSGATPPRGTVPAILHQPVSASVVVEEEEEGLTIHATSVAESQQEATPPKTSRWCWTPGILAVAFLMIFAILLILLGRSDNNNRSNNQGGVSVAPTVAPSARPTVLDTETNNKGNLSFLQSVIWNVSSQESLLVPNSPQHQAWEWCLQDDLFQTMEAVRIVQRYSLAVLYFGTGGPAWKQQFGFLSDKHECEWLPKQEKDTCDDRGILQALILREFIVEKEREHNIWKILTILLVLAHNGLKGTLPTELYALTSLKRLSLDDNLLSGRIPTVGIVEMTNLRILSLGDNGLVGTVPYLLFERLLNLKRINLGRNQLYGVLPPQVGSLKNLTSLDLATNEFSGSLPSELFTMTQLQQLNLARNRFQGSLPTTVGILTRMTMLDLSSNQFTGTLPSELGQLSQLSDLRASELNLTGTLPTEIGSIPTLERLILSYCDFSGSVPTEWARLTSLTKVSLQGNRLVGNVSFFCASDSLDLLLQVDLQDTTCDCCSCCTNS